MKKQGGSVYRRGGFWVLRFRETVNQQGTLRTVQRAEKLAPCRTHKSKRSLEELINERMREINQRNQQPELVITMEDFYRQVFLPHVDDQLRPSMGKGVRDVWKNHLEARVREVLLRNVETHDVSRWLKDIAQQDRNRKTGERLRAETLKRIKSMLSALFKLARNEGYYKQPNPVKDTRVPKAAGSQETYAYSHQEIEHMLQLVLDPTGQAALAVAAFTGLRAGEIEGLRWEDWHDGAIWVARASWKGQMLEPKTDASKSPVPIVPTLATRLTEFRRWQGNPISGPMFPGNRLKKPANLNNIVNRSIRIALDRCLICHESHAEHKAQPGKFDHQFVRDDQFPKWRGWHAFRRGLATNLHDLGVNDKTIQAILRHTNVAVTQRCYIETLPRQTVTAMLELENAHCALHCALNEESEKTQDRVN
jgi:integrase